MNYHLGDRVIVTDVFSYYWSCVGTVVKVEPDCVSIHMPITGGTIRRSRDIELIERGRRVWPNLTCIVF